MREFIRIVESATTVDRQFFVHVTPSENLASIQAKGLIPNHNGGNYDDVRWESLNGVYASRYAEQLVQYLNAHLITDYLLVVIEADMATTLPDEDLIDIHFEHVFEQIMRKLGWTIRSPEFEDMQPGTEEWDMFLDALSSSFGSPDELVREAAEIWLEMKVGLDGDGEMMWGELKDAIVKKYPKMVHPKLGHQHSIRIPAVVGFNGSTRIVGIMQVEDHRIDIIYSNVPEEAHQQVQELVDAIVYA